MIQSNIFKNKKRKLIQDEPELFNNYVKQKPTVQKYKLSSMTDSEGLEKAYANGDVFVNGQTMYIAGSHTAQDFYDDVTKIPIWGDLRNSSRYKAAEKVLKENPFITNVVGHSLGGSVSLELEKNYPEQIKHSTTYGAPVLSFGKESNPDRYRHYLDPVSILDRNSKMNIKWNLDPINDFSLTHSYKNLGNKITRFDLVENTVRNYEPPKITLPTKTESIYTPPISTSKPSQKYDFDNDNYISITE